MKFSLTNSFLAFFTLTALAFGAFGFAPAQAAGPVKTPAPEMEVNTLPMAPVSQMIVKYKPTSDSYIHPSQANKILALSQAAGVSLRYKRAMSGSAHVLTLPQRLPLAQAQAMAARLMTSADVEYAEPDLIMRAVLDAPLDTVPAPAARPLQISPNDPQYGNQWHYYETWGINAPAAWDITTGSADVVVAVLDTGITNHAEFIGRTVPGYDFITDFVIYANDGNGRDNDPSDPGDWVATNECPGGNAAENSSWHGTHTAGTIGAAGNNNLGVSGIDWNGKILPVRVLGKCGGSTSDIADAITWSAGLAVSGVALNANPAKVLNLSLGGTGSCGTTIQNAINAVNAAGAVVVVSAGNSNVDAGSSTPANCNGVITVSATNRTGNRAYYSNYGTSVEISAPGGAQGFANDPNGVLSTLNSGTQGPGADNYVYYQGTSMAAPHISGVISLMFSANPALTPAQVLQVLQNTARAFPLGGTCNISNCGSGIVDAGAAVASAAGVPVPTPTATQTPTLGCNPGAITINDEATGLPYPSAITLAGLDVFTLDVNVRLFGFTHSWPSDADLLLVGPQGQNALIMSDAGGGPGGSNINLTLDDSAAEYLGYTGSFASGTYRPTNYEDNESLPAPAPASSGQSALATFYGTNPNGTWNLYVVDDTSGDSGIITGGWCLDVTASSASPTPYIIFATSTPAHTSTATASLTNDPANTTTPTFTRTLSRTPSITPTATITFTPSMTPTITPTATITQTRTITPPNTITPTRTPTITITPTATLPTTGIKYEDLVVDEARGKLYGADKANSKIDVIDMTTLNITSSYLLVFGAAPVSLDLSPDGNELAVGQSALSQVAFINLTNGLISELASPLSGSNTKAFDVIYGRTGTLYVLSDIRIHVIDLNQSPHAEDISQYLAASYEKFGAISSDKNTLFYVTNTHNSAYNSLRKINVSAGLAKPVELGYTVLSGADGDAISIKLALINDDTLLTSYGSVYNISNLTPKAKKSQFMLPATNLPGRSFYVTVDSTPSPDQLLFYDNDSSHQVSWLNAAVNGITGAIVASSDGNMLFVSSTGGMAKFTIGATPPGTAVELPASTRNYKDLAIDLPRSRVYGTDMSGRIDVMDLETFAVLESYLLHAGAKPTGIDLSPDGNELAVALNGLEAILFLDPETGAEITRTTPQLTMGSYYENMPSNVIYGRPGRLYSDGNANGSDYIHTIDTTTYTWLAKSSNTFSGAELAITDNKNTLYANRLGSPNNIYLMNIQTDTPTFSAMGPHGPVSATKFAIIPDGSKVFTAQAQVWSGNMQNSLGTLEGGSGKLIEFLPSQGMVVLAATSTGGDVLRFVSATNYRLLLTISPITGGTIIEMESTPDGNLLIVNTSNGMEAIDVSALIPRVTSIVRMNPNPQFSSSTVGFTVTFSVPVTGVNLTTPFSDFALTTTGVTGAEIVSVSGTGTTYTVNVNTGLGTGSIRLDIVDDNSIQNAAGNPLGGIGVGDGNYTAGEAYTILTPTPTSTTTLTPTQTSTATITPTPTETATVTLTPTETATSTITLTPTETYTATITSTPTETATPTEEPTHTPSITPSITVNVTATATPSYTPTPTDTTPPTLTPTLTGTRTKTITPTPTETATFTLTPTNTATSTPTKTQTPSTGTLTFLSIGAQDGWVLESAENSNIGGTMNPSITTFNLGDDPAKRQYRGILSFNTGSIPDNATITAVTLKVKRVNVVGGGNPLAIFQGFMVDLRNGMFGTAALQISDFQSVGSGTFGPFSPALTNNAYSINLTGGQTLINKLTTNSGLTQLRLRFKLDDNNNGLANYLTLHSGNATAAADRPQLMITYTVP